MRSPPKESGDRGSGRPGDHGVADVDIDAARDPSGSQARLEHGADAGIHVTVANASGGDRVGQEHHAVLDLDRCDLDDEALDGLGVVVGAQGQEVDVARRAAQIEGRQEQPALEHEPLVMSRADDAAQEALEDVELEQLGSGALFRAREALQREVGGAGEVGVGGLRFHKRILRARRRVGSTLGKWRAIARSFAGAAPRRLSQRLSASAPNSWPSRWPSRKASRMQRSAL